MNSTIADIRTGVDVAAGTLSGDRKKRVGRDTIVYDELKAQSKQRSEALFADTLGAALPKQVGYVSLGTDAINWVETGVRDGIDNRTGRYSSDYESVINNNQAEIRSCAASYLYLQDPAKANQFLNYYMPGYHIDTTISGNQHVVLVNEKENKAILAFRGTEVNEDPLTAAQDLEADATIATMGKLQDSYRFDLAIDRYHQAREKYRDLDLVVTGHSLGGSQAMWVSKETGANAVVFNPGYLGQDGKLRIAKGLSRWFTGKDKKRGAEYNNVKFIRTDGDIVSSGYRDVVGTDAGEKDGIINRRGWSTRPFGYNGVQFTNAKPRTDAKIPHGLIEFLPEKIADDYTQMRKGGEPVNAMADLAVKPELSHTSSVDNRGPSRKVTGFAAANRIPVFQPPQFRADTEAQNPAIIAEARAAPRPMAPPQRTPINQASKHVRGDDQSDGTNKRIRTPPLDAARKRARDDERADEANKRARDDKTRKRERDAQSDSRVRKVPKIGGATNLMAG